MDIGYKRVFNSPGEHFRKLVNNEQPLIICGVINSYCCLLAKKANIKAIYLSGAGVANASFGLPDLGMTSLSEVTEEVRRITDTVDLPLLVDADTGWGGGLNVARTVSELSKAGAAGLHLEDQTWPKRCGHRPGKEVTSSAEMVDKIKAAVDARIDSEFVIMARTDALAVGGLEAAIDRAKAYVEHGADMIFAEAITEIGQFKQFVDALPNVPILANITEYGKTPLFNAKQLAQVGVKIMLFPLTAFRAMSYAALDVYKTISETGTQKVLLDKLQTREELYEILEYDRYEEKV